MMRALGIAGLILMAALFAAAVAFAIYPPRAAADERPCLTEEAAETAMLTGAPGTILAARLDGPAAADFIDRVRVITGQRLPGDTVLVFIHPQISTAFVIHFAAGCAVVWTDSMPLDMARELIALAKAGRAA